MISFRFHVVSITAVFLAIAVGVVVGSTFVDRAIVDSLEDRIDGVSASLDERRAEIADLQDELGRLEDYTEASAAFAVSGRLDGQTVLVAAVRGVDDGAVRRLVTLAGQAGAATPGIVWIEPRWELEDEAAVDELAALIGRRAGRPDTLRVLAWEALVAELQAPVRSDEGEAEDPTATTAPLGVPEAPDSPETTEPPAPADPPTPVVLPGLLEAGFVSFEPLTEGALLTDFVASSPAVALVTGPAAEPALRPLGPGLVGSLVEADLAVVVAELYDGAGDDEGPARGETAVASLPEGAATEVSVVDHAELRVGQVATVLALADLRRGVVGHYGFGDGAAGVVPTWTPL